MGWIAITINTLHEAKVARAVDAYSQKAKAQGQADRAPGITQGVVDYVRRKIASNPKNRVDADPTKVPAGLRDMVVDMVIFRLRRSVDIALSEDDRRALERYEADLNRIADGRDTVDQPDSPVSAEVENTAGIEVVSKPPRVASREQLGGLT